MKSIALIGLLFSSGCLGTTMPSGVVSIHITSNATVNGVFVGDQVQLSAAAFDLNGNVIPVAVTYTTSDASVVTVTNNGTITAIGVGSATIVIAAAGQTAHYPVTVDGNITSAVGVFPTSLNLHVGGTGVFSASALTTLGNPARNKTFTWASADNSKVTVDASGAVAAVAVTAGAHICATVTDGSAKQGCATVVVTP